MRNFTPLLVLLLAVSLIMNGVLFLKYRNGRSIMTINGVNITKSDMDSFLELTHGPQYKADRAVSILVHDAAVKNNITVSDSEVNAKFKEAKEIDWQFAYQMNSAPWLVGKQLESLRTKLELQRLLSKDVKVTDDDISDEYKVNPSAYDIPNRAQTEVALLKDDKHLTEVTQLLNQNNPPVKPATIKQNFPGQVFFLGDGDIYTFQQHLGTAEQSLIFGMKPGDVVQKLTKDYAPEFAAKGFKFVLIKLNKIDSGKRYADLNPSDPKDMATKKETTDKIKVAVALRHASNAQEYLRDLLNKASIQSENHEDADTIKRYLLPDDAQNSK